MRLDGRALADPSPYSSARVRLGAMPIVRATVILPHTTGLPQDVSTNTFHFLTAASPPASTDLDALDAGLAAFYTAVGPQIGTAVTRATNGCRREYYDLEDTPPRAPVRTTPFTLAAAAAGSTNLPLECAAVVSFQGARASGLPQARRRGRVYIGPLRGTAADLTSAFPPLSSTMITALQTAAVNLDGAMIGSTSWVVYSRTDDDAVLITNGWVDNAIDTQRRRETRASSRTTFTL